MKPTPKPYQLAGVQHLVQRFQVEDCLLEASSTGYGKMYVACFVAQAMNLKLAVVAPKPILTKWKRTAELIGVPVIFVSNYEKVKSKKFEFGEWEIYKKRYKWHLDSDTLLVFDECHKMKTRDTIVAKVGVGAARCPCKKLLISATIAENPLHMYVTGMLLGLHDGSGDYFHWCKKNHVKTGPFGMYYGGGEEGLIELRKEIYPERGHRMRTADIPDFPENQIETMGIELSKRDNKELERILKELEEKRVDDVELSIVDQLRARQEIEAIKVDQMAEIGKMYQEEGNSLVIFLNFKDSIHLMQKHFPEAAVIIGGQNEDERQEGIDAFQANKVGTIICQLQTGGVGLDLHDLEGVPRVSLISPSYSAVDLIQALGRIHRSGAVSPAVQRIIFASDSIEAKIERKVHRKIHAIETLNDGDLSFFDARDV